MEPTFLHSPLADGIAALSAAFFWALALIWFSRLGQQLPVIQINFYKKISRCHHSHRRPILQW